MKDGLYVCVDDEGPVSFAMFRKRQEDRRATGVNGSAKRKWYNVLNSCLDTVTMKREGKWI